MSAVKSLLATLLAFGFISMVGCSDEESDENPPVISNLSHTNNEKVIGSRTINFSVDVTDDVGATVMITHNNVEVSSTKTNDTYTASITLEDRDNNDIAVSASDADNTTTETLTLNYPFLTFTDGQAASVVIGQPDFNSFSFNRGGALGGNGFDGPAGIIVVNNKLYIADAGNSRVLGFNSIPTTYEEGVNATANFVIGQLGYETFADGLNANQLKFPTTLATDRSVLFVGQGSSTGGRVHMWNAIPESNVDANNVIGQTEFGVETTGCNQTTLDDDIDGLYVVDNKLIVSDTSNSRVLIWNSLPTTNGKATDVVLGQQSFDFCAANDGNDDGDNIDAEDGPSASTLNRPRSIWSDGTRLIVADNSNRRVLIWNTFPTSHFQAADVVLGQADFSSAVNQGAPTTTAISATALASNGNQLFVSDVSNERVLIWDSIPTTAGIWPADGVLGNSNLNVSDVLNNNAELNRVRSIYIHNDKLFVSDKNDNRVLIFKAQ